MRTISKFWWIGNLDNLDIYQISATLSGIIHTIEQGNNNPEVLDIPTNRFKAYHLMVKRVTACLIIDVEAKIFQLALFLKDAGTDMIIVDKIVPYSTGYIFTPLTRTSPFNGRNQMSVAIVYSQNHWSVHYISLVLFRMRGT